MTKISFRAVPIISGPSLSAVALDGSHNAVDGLLTTAGLWPKTGILASAESIASDYPAESDVRDGVSYGYGAYAGDVVLPAESDVKSGVGYGSGGTEFDGTLEVGGGGGNRCF